MRGITLVLAAVLSACTSPPISSRLSECGFLSEGDIGPRVEQAFYAPDDCYRDCLAGASCDELQAALCRSSLELLLRCDAQCAHRCLDGALIATRNVCDGVPQCADGSDEAGCPNFRCDDGTEIALGAHCNGWPECPTGEDERGCVEGGVDCVGEFGATYNGIWFVCDGYMHCLDGSDENACDEYPCANGSSARTRPGTTPRCDGAWNCTDGSDENGCAEVQAMCGG